MEYNFDNLKKYKKSELVDILKNAKCLPTNFNKLKVDDLKKIIIDKKIKNENSQLLCFDSKNIKKRFTQEEFEEHCWFTNKSQNKNKNKKTEMELDEIKNKNQKILSEIHLTEIIDLNDLKQREKIKYIEILHYYEDIDLSTYAKVFTFKFKKDYVGHSDIERFFGIPYYDTNDFVEKEKLEKYTKYECTIEGFKNIYCNEMPPECPYCCKWDDTPALEFRPYFGILKLVHGRSILI